MTYRVRLTEGRTLTIQPGGVDDQQVSIPLAGRNLDGYGETVATAFIWQLENFAHTKAPHSPLRGQVWYDRGEDLLKIWTGSMWQRAGQQPPLALAGLRDVAAGGTGGLLRYDGEIWRRHTPQRGYRSLVDTAPDRPANHYPRVNNAATSVDWQRKFSVIEITGEISIERLPMQALCDWLRQNCSFVPPPVDPILSAFHSGGSCTIPLGSTTCTAAGSVSLSVDTNANPGADLRYDWSVQDGGPGMLRNPVTGEVVSSLTTTVPSVNTRVTGGVGSQTRTVKVTVRDNNRPVGEQVLGSRTDLSAVYQFQAAELPPAIISASHVGGTCTVPAGQPSCAASGWGSVVANYDNFPFVGTVTYRWIVNDGGGPLFVPTAGGDPVNSTDTALPTVVTRVTGTPGQTILRRFAVQVLDDGVPVGTMDAGTAQYRFEAQEVTPTHTATVSINGIASANRDGFSFDISGRPAGATSTTVTAGTNVTVGIFRTDTAWQLDGVGGCGGGLDQSSQNSWTFSFSMPSNDCAVDISTSQITQMFEIRTQMPAGFTISPEYNDGAFFAAGTPLSFDITTVDFGRTLTGVTGCGGSLSPGVGEGQHGPWTYSVIMPANDCVVAGSSTATPPVQAVVTGNCSSIIEFPIWNLHFCQAGILNFIDSINLSPLSTVSGHGGTGTYNITYVPGSLVNNLSMTPGSVTAAVSASFVIVQFTVPDTAGVSDATLSGSISVDIRVEDALNPSNFATVTASCEVLRMWTCNEPP